MANKYKNYSMFDKFYDLQRIFHDDYFYDYDFEKLCLSIRHTFNLNPDDEYLNSFRSFMDVPINKNAVKLWLVLNIEKHENFGYY